jgi:hypothetical protein
MEVRRSWWLDRRQLVTGAASTVTLLADTSSIARAVPVRGNVIGTTSSVPNAIAGYINPKNPPYNAQGWQKFRAALGVFPTAPSGNPSKDSIFRFHRLVGNPL